MTKVIANFKWDCVRSGDVEGLFVTTLEDIEKITGKYVYFGEILGKHPEVSGDIDGLGKDINIVTDDQEFIAKFESIMGSGTVSGYNPFDYYEEDEPNEEEYNE